MIMTESRFHYLEQHCTFLYANSCCFIQLVLSRILQCQPIHYENSAPRKGWCLWHIVAHCGTLSYVEVNMQGQFHFYYMHISIGIRKFTWFTLMNICVQIFLNRVRSHRSLCSWNLHSNLCLPYYIWKDLFVREQNVAHPKL